MHVDQALIEAMEKVRDAMLDFEVAAEHAGVDSKQESGPTGDEPPNPAAEPRAEDAMDTMPEADEPEHDDDPKFTSLGAYRFGAGSPKVHHGPPIEPKASSKMPVGRRR